MTEENKHVIIAGVFKDLSQAAQVSVSIAPPRTQDNAFPAVGHAWLLSLLALPSHGLVPLRVGRAERPLALRLPRLPFGSS